MKTQLLFILISFAVTLAMTPMVRFFAVMKGYVARPREDRWHKKTTALLGGIAIYLGIGLPLWWVSDFMSVWNRLLATGNGASLPSVAAVIWVGATVLFILGLTDDFINLKPQSKLIGQIFVASMVTFLGFRLNWFTSLTLDTMFTLIWIVGVTNAFNLLDNMDGLCAGVAMVASLSMATLYLGTDPLAAVVALIIVGACAGFLVFNFKPASIFMGDCGSLVIGFAIAVLSLYHGELDGGNRLSALAVPVLILLVPILDTTLVTIIRLLSGRRASTGGRDHTSHRLVLMGLSEKDAVLFLYGIGAVSGVAAVFVSRSDTLTSPAAIIPIAISVTLMGVYLSQLRVYPEKEFSVLRQRKFTPVLIELTYKRQILMIILDFGLVAFSYYLSYRLRFDGSDFAYYFNVFLKSLPVILAAKLLVFYLSGIYRGFWQYISTGDVFLYVRTSGLATLLGIACVTILYRFKDFSKGVFIIDWFLTTGFLLGTRGSFRLFTDTMKRKTLEGDPVIIYGAGRGGELLLREILNNKKLRVKPIGFIDDDPLKKGKRLQGFPILGTLDELGAIHQKNRFDGLLISFNDPKTQRAKKTAEFCRANGIFLKQFIVTLQELDSTYW